MPELKITFVIPNIDISGGIKAVFEFADHLVDFGHQVDIVYPAVPMPGPGFPLGPRKVLRRIRGAARNLLSGTNVTWFNLKAQLKRVPSLREKHIPDADIVVATWWETAGFVADYSRRKGEKYYLIQHYETWGGPANQVNRTFKMGLKNIVNSSWLKDILVNRLDAKVTAMILHSPDLHQFFPEPAGKPTQGVRILMPYRSQYWKGFDTGLEAFEAVRETEPDVRLVLFGLQESPAIPRDAEFHKRPVKEALRKLYNSCDIFVFPSREEGFGMPPMEAMACRLPVVTTLVGAVPDYTIPGETALVCPPEDHRCLAESIKLLIRDNSLRDRIAEEGYLYVTRNFGWEKFSRQLESVFLGNYPTG